MRTHTSIYKQLTGIDIFIGTRYWFILLLTASWYSCSNIQTDNAVELTEIEVIDRVIFYEGQKYNGVVYHVFTDPNRKLFNVDSPIKIKGVPIEISRYIDYAFTVVDGKINGPATGTIRFHDMLNHSSFMFSDEKKIFKEALGLTFNTNIVSLSNIYGVGFIENINVYNSQGDLIYSLDKNDFMENCWISSDDIIIKNLGKEINLFTGKISEDDDVWIGSYSIGKKENGEWEVIVNEYNRITMEERTKVGGLELRPEASPVMGLGDFYNSIALRLITGVY